MGLADGLQRLCRFGKRSGGDERRIVRPGFPSSEYCNNEVKSSKYTVVSFLPFNLFEQFHRPINLYFLLVTALQFVPSVSPVSPLTTLVPLGIAFLITAVKEGVDDWRRHRLDNACNAKQCHIINIDTMGVECIRCSDIQVGDMLLLLPMEVVPCDVVLLLSSGENGEVMISTEALDGEAVCKRRYAILGDMYAQRPTLSTITTDSLQDEEASIRAAAEFIKEAACIIDSEGPKPFLNSYSGVAKVLVPHDNEADEAEETLLGISAENVALSSSIVNNTRFALGVAVLTGNETRVAMTRAAPPTKWSIIDRYYNRMVIVVFIVQFILVTVYVSLSDTELHEDQGKLWYLGNYDVTMTEYLVILPLRFFSLVSPMVPLSFKVMLDASKAYISELITWDGEMSGEYGTTEVHNSSLMEDLGQVEYLMTDKTGTLTCNAMTLKRIVTAKGTVLTPSAPREVANTRLALLRDESLLQLLRVMVYCNTVESTARMTANGAQPSSSSSSVGAAASSRVAPTSAWVSPSPDEVALVEGAALLGIKLLERTRKRVFVAFGSKVESATILHVLSFTSERRRVSVLLQIDDDPRYLLLTKGSDESVLPRCIESSYNKRITSNKLNRLSHEGLRTLVSAYRYLADDEAQTWLVDIRKAGAVASADVRTLAVAEVCERVEKDLVFCGITAVEDKLQENVCSTISQMRAAGIRVWMLTGDKSQAARQTAIASGLVGPDDRMIALTPNEVESTSVREHLNYVERYVKYALGRKQFEEAEQRHKSFSSFYVRSGLRDVVCEFTNPTATTSRVCHTMISSAPHGLPDVLHNNTSEHETEVLMNDDNAVKENRGYVLQLSGKTIELMKECGNEQLFLDFKRVVLHASTVVCSRMTPDQKSFLVQVVKNAGHVTLAIGDGGNDVSMIQCAHVGVGIRGREGTQAAVASDVSISRFHFLSRLLLFHGHTAYQRSSIIVQQNFWKTVALAWIQLLFNIYTGFSGVSFWDSFSLMMYNSLFTAPVTFLCVMNMPLSPSILLSNPPLYRLCQKGRYLNAITFYGYILRGFLHGTMIFYLAYGFWNGTSGGVMRWGHTMDRTCDYYACCFALVTLHSSIILLETHSITLFHWAALLWSVAAMFILYTLYALGSKNHSFLELLRNGVFYLQWILGVAAPLLTLSIYAAVKLFFFPDLLQFQRLIVRAVSRNQNVGPLWPILEDSPSGFWGSFSLFHLFHDETRRSHPSSVAGALSLVEVQSLNGETQEASSSMTATTAMEPSRHSSVLSEPFLRKV
ncbi:phospholipid-transporting ATPase-like protein [Trypanosoma grayi]|uniref:phospholipid-transporting ATPase-like protein n=1 Tax=Trypanosoma grayi TaxID=71804 RepID=UPI0004F49805|nr:phospholipid-transporting ATPase-like protein [Trypanosoma grayi]KEG09784.1 phospholipid-transporting ATPase-like protein [Trypanosoma grayi]